jgi:hypothetical protein
MTPEQVYRQVADALDARSDHDFSFEILVFSQDPDEERWLSCWVRGGYDSVSSGGDRLNPPDWYITDAYCSIDDDAFYGPWTPKQKQAARDACEHWIDNTNER